MDRLIQAGLNSGLPLFIVVASLFIGVLALVLTPREEEPQIVVPMVDVEITAPGISARQVERQITTPVEKLLAQISGVEHVYSASRTGSASVTLRFHVGEDREDALLNTYNKLYSHQQLIPPGVSEWNVKPVEVDDVPILMFALWSSEASKYDDYHLRRLADEISTELKAIPQTSAVVVAGGRSREIQIQIDPKTMTARHTTSQDVLYALRVSNRLDAAGTVVNNNRVELIQSGETLKSLEDLRSLVVNVIDGRPVYLHEIATVMDGPQLPVSYTWIDFAGDHGFRSDSQQKQPMVVISVAKQRGSNAVWVANDVLERLQVLSETLLPPEVRIEVLRNYGETADEKVNNLTTSLGVAVLTVVLFIGIFLGWRAAVVVGFAVPVCYGITLGLDLLFGYTINRVTLFALILSLGLLVDDPITGVDNITRFISNRSEAIRERIVAAMMEIRGALIMSTITIVFAFIPLAFITGMMGPYMAPMAFNVPVSVISSTVVAFLVTPWLAARLLKPSARREVNSETAAGFYRRWITPLVTNHRKARTLLAVVAVLFLISAALPLFRLVPLKLLPFDNKNEIQVVIDLPEHSTLEQTAAIAESVGARLRRMPEVKTLAYFIGIPSPMDFNGLVRHYYQREGPHLGEIRLTLADKSVRAEQSHALVLKMRAMLPQLPADTHVKIVEVPPGPPVIATLVGEIYADDTVGYEQQRLAAEVLSERLSAEPFVGDVDTVVEQPVTLWRFVTDKQKAALSGIATEDVNDTLTTANAGLIAGHLESHHEATPLPIVIRLPESQRSIVQHLGQLHVRGRPGIARSNLPPGLIDAPTPMVSLHELGEFRQLRSDLPIFHKDLRPVVYVTAELSGRTPAEVIADLTADENQLVRNRDWKDRSYLNSGGTASWSLPKGTRVTFSGEGEWQITLRVFRDMGIAFAFALTVIYLVLRIQVQSAALSLIIMSAIPLTFIGIMPGFLLMNSVVAQPVAGYPDPVLFTATAMIGMIALAGIVVRNSLILVEFIRQATARGESLSTAISTAGEVRIRPILLTAGTTLLGNLIITLDPIFSGLALAIIFGIVASTLFTLLVVPAVYFLVFNPNQEVQ